MARLQVPGCGQAGAAGLMGAVLMGAVLCVMKQVSRLTLPDELPAELGHARRSVFAHPGRLRFDHKVSVKRGQLQLQMFHEITPVSNR